MDDMFEYYYTIMKKVHGDSVNDETIRRYAQNMADKEKTVKKGDNIVHIDYFQGLLIQDDFEAIEKELGNTGLELSRYDKTGVLVNSIEDLKGVVEIALASNFASEMFKEVAGGFLWDSIKGVCLYVFKQIKGKKIIKRSVDGTETEKQATLFLHIQKDQKTSIDLSLTGDLVNQELAQAALDKAFEFAKELPSNEIPKRSILVEVNLDGGELTLIDTDAIFDQKIRKQEEGLKSKGKKSRQKR